MVTLDKITALCKRRAFVYPSSDIYGGLNGVYDFGPLGCAMKENIRTVWKRSVQQQERGEVICMEGALLGKTEVWQASGHIAGFHDPLVDCTACKRRFRADELDLNGACPVCGTRNAWTDVRQFNLMFKTTVGAVEDPTAIAYLRPETAQSIFVNFKNVLSSYRIKIPFGIAQIGKSFRNEITPKQFLFRTREFEQMELEWFCQADHAATDFEFWLDQRKKFYILLGFGPENIRFRAHEKDELAHYAAACTDVEFNFPFGWKELEGIANRGNYDLSQHIRESKKDLAVFNEETRQSFVPHVIECSVGTDRLMLALLCQAYHEEMVEGEEQRIVLRLPARVAPVTAAFMPLVKKISEPIHAVYKDIWHRGYRVQFDETGSIGKRYRRQDEIGTPLCFTYDFESEKDTMVTVRYRDSMRQERVSINAIEDLIKKELRQDA